MVRIPYSQNYSSTIFQSIYYVYRWGNKLTHNLPQFAMITYLVLSPPLCVSSTAAKMRYAMQFICFMFWYSQYNLYWPSFFLFFIIDDSFFRKTKILMYRLYRLLLIFPSVYFPTAMHILIGKSRILNFQPFFPLLRIQKKSNDLHFP